MDINKLLELVIKGKSQRQLANELLCSQSTIGRWLNKLDIKTNVPKKLFLCKFCGETHKSKFYEVTDGHSKKKHIHKSVCKKCHSIRTNCYIQQYKKDCVLYKGGKCSICGYNKCIGSLVFHHRDPKIKDPNWHRMRSWKLDRIKKEIDKCVLVCANCHGEIHYKNKLIVK